MRANRVAAYVDKHPADVWVVSISSREVLEWFSQQLDPDPAFPWCAPVISHVDWDYRPVVRRVLRWVNNVAHGKEDRRQSFALGKYVEGGTIGPVAS